MKSIEELYTIHGIFKDQNDDGYADQLDGHVIINRFSDLTEKKFAANLCARIGYETMAIDLPVLKFYSEGCLKKGTNIYLNRTQIQDADKDLVCFKLDKNDEGCCLTVEYSSLEALKAGGEYLYGRLPYVWKVKKEALKLKDVLAEVKKLLNIDEAYIIKILIDKKYKGIYKLCIALNRLSTDIEKLINQNQYMLKWENIREVEFAFSDGENICVFNEELEKASDKMCMSFSIDNNLPIRNFDMADIFSTRGILNDDDNDFLPDELLYNIVIPDDADDFEFEAACNIASRLGIETLGIKLPLVFGESEVSDFRSSIIIGRICERYGFDLKESSIDCIKSENGVIIAIPGKGQELVNASKYFSNLLPDLNRKGYSLSDVKEDVYNFLSGRSLLSQFSYLDAYLKKGNEKCLNAECLYEEGLDIDIHKAKSYFKGKYSIEDIRISPFNERKEVFRIKREIPWEADEFKKILSNRLYPIIKKGDSINIIGILSEEKEVRDILKNQITEEIRERGGEVSVSIYCSYKQGISFIMEDFIPRAVALGLKNKIDEVVIKFKPFLKPGKIEWNDEDGAIPNLSSHDPKDEDKWFDLPIRWVQELYPVDDLISREIGIERDKIRFEKMADDCEETYRIILKDSLGNVILQDAYSVKYSERPYLDEYPKIGMVHPDTGWIKVILNGDEIIDENIKTDLENVWDIYQKEILAECKKYILEKTNNQPTAEKQPFFKELYMKISLSEPDYELGIRQDMISSLDALHEDMYFAGLDFFKTFGERTVSETLQEPGLILPCIVKENGKSGNIEAILYDQLSKAPKISINNSIYEFKNIIEPDIYINRIVLKDGRADEVYIDIRTDKCESVKEVIECYCELFNDGILPLFDSIRYSCINKMIFNIFESNKYKYSVELFINKNIDEDLIGDEYLDVKDIEITDENVIGYEDYIELIDKFKKVPDINVWKASTSYQGRDIYAIDLTVPFKSSIVSKIKLINYKPTYMLINRHHANEVSSTNSAFYLIKNMLTDKKCNDYLKKINLAIIPYENVDGGYIHYQLQKDNPKWKLHIARFNSVGKEFARDYWINSKYGESLAMPKVWRRWLPDMVVDNHGVPSHEWDQQFSGYVSPWFKGFWLPRALFYGYFWYVDSPDYPEHKGLNESIQEYVAEWINKDEEISSWNADWRDRFEKYAHGFMPKMFPADYYENLIFYWIPYKPNKDAWHVSHRFPWITAVDWTTEVSDETAQGDYLRLCLKTHNIADMAVIHMLSNAELNIEELSFEKDGYITIKNIRKRPLKVKNKY